MNILLVGYGKMGKAIETVALSRGHRIVERITRQNAEQLTPNLPPCDVAIEFTAPHSAPNNIIKCIELGLPVVCGSTGWLDQMGRIRKAVEENNGAFFYSSNFSIGVYLFWSAAEKLAALMSRFGQYRARICEIHHTQKLDAPSGTAITLAERVLAQSPHLDKWQLDTTGELSPQILPITALRQENVPGTHTLAYDSPIDRIELTHIAHSREGFALGAVMAAEWLQNRKGIFGMSDMLGF